MSAEVISLDFARARREVGLSLADIRVAMDREIRRLDAETTAAKRKRIDGLLTNISAHLSRQPPEDAGLPSDVEAS